VGIATAASRAPEAKADAATKTASGAPGLYKRSRQKMPRDAVLALCLLSAAVLGGVAAGKGVPALRGNVSQYNVVWTTPQSTLSAGSMPVGSLYGDVAGNVWFEPTSGTLQVLVSRSDAWAESNDLLKVTLVQVCVDELAPRTHTTVTRSQTRLPCCGGTI
jgi:hypothetical protein